MESWILSYEELIVPVEQRNRYMPNYCDISGLPVAHEVASDERIYSSDFLDKILEEISQTLGSEIVTLNKHTAIWKSTEENLKELIQTNLIGYIQDKFDFRVTWKSIWIYHGISKNIWLDLPWDDKKLGWPIKSKIFRDIVSLPEYLQKDDRWKSFSKTTEKVEVSSWYIHNLSHMDPEDHLIMRHLAINVNNIGKQYIKEIEK